MAKEYKTRDGKAIVGWKTVNGKRIPISESTGGSKKKPSPSTEKTDVEGVIASAKTDKQVRAALEKAGYSIARDNSEEHGVLSVWLDDNTRVYKRGREYVVQKWRKTDMTPTGVPTFFSTGLPRK